MLLFTYRVEVHGDLYGHEISRLFEELAELSDSGDGDPVFDALYEAIYGQLLRTTFPVEAPDQDRSLNVIIIKELA